MKIFALGIDGNSRSTRSYVEVPLSPLSETEAISSRQDGVLWRLGYRNTTTWPRTSKDYESASGPSEMHLGGPPHFVGVMSGHAELTLQDGSCWRLCAGEFHYVAPGSLHHANNPSLTTVTIFNLLLPGTPMDTQPYRFK